MSDKGGNYVDRKTKKNFTNHVKYVQLLGNTKGEGQKERGVSMYEVDRQKLREFRKRRKITQSEASRIIGGQTYSKVYSIEKNMTKHVRASDLFALADTYDVPVEELIKKTN